MVHWDQSMLYVELDLYSTLGLPRKRLNRSTNVEFSKWSVSSDNFGYLEEQLKVHVPRLCHKFMERWAQNERQHWYTYYTKTRLVSVVSSQNISYGCEGAHASSRKQKSTSQSPGKKFKHQNALQVLFRCRHFEKNTYMANFLPICWSTILSMS
jgi:hypothetical protein